ncbi:serine/threonine-protein phosphatase 4 regulatory subunit 3 [Eucalyptus grandis]|uniref:serine/threonine-protein phosphatase 4 regulatory subunit 3 n=1 Tax=Eucalyptus grandis TaxID=71139 RepID=UPI00192EFEBD|nr:serine/threonine-protein phosphatase 4 regulatory subunit 3 [Eucalyptus grandis]
MGGQEKSSSNSNSMQRVKVYQLNDEGKWDDHGTGHVTVDYLERSEDLGIFVFDEDNETLLLHRISSEDIYRKQEDSIISWRDPEYATELALSFQETSGCSYIWDHICNVQRNMHFSSLNNNTFHSVNSELRELPPVELSTLPLIHKTVYEGRVTDKMQLIDLILNDQEFLRKLMHLFRLCEDLEHLSDLQMICRIVKGIILLNSPQIFEKIFGDELIMDIIGSLEYDPEVPHVQQHRNFLKEHVVFKEAIPIRDPIVLSKIHQTYRVGYLKDVVLARMLDDTIIANLNSIIHSNNAIVVSLLKDDSTFIQELFERLDNPATPSESKKNLVYFLHDFCSLSKSLQMVQQLRLFRDLVGVGIFKIIADALQSDDNRLILTGTDIIILFMNQDPNLLRSYVVRPDDGDGAKLLGLLVKGMVTDFGDDMHCQFLEILRSLLDSYTLSGGQRDSVIEIFYEKHLGQLIDVIVASCPSVTSHSLRNEMGSGRVKNQQRTKPEILSNICELLCFCVLHHPYRIKCNFLLNNVADKVLLLMQRREKYLVVAAVRFFRTILSRHDEHIISHIVRNNLLKPIVDAFVRNGDRYNLLNSVVLELLEYIRKENLKLLLKYIVDSFWNELVKFEHLPCIQSFKVKYEQCLENGGTRGPINVSDPRKRIDERALEKEEEDYFNEDSDEEDTASASASASQSRKVQPQPVLSNGVSASHQSISRRTGGLVDYDDDEDDEDYRPPPRRQKDNPDDEEATMDSIRLKRKLAPKDKEPDISKRPRLNKNPKSKDNSVFAALCSTLSQAVLPSKKTASNMHSSPQAGDADKNAHEQNHEDFAPTRGSSDSSSSDDETHKEKESASPRSCSECVQSTSDNRQLGSEDTPLVQPKSSPEMAVNGS